MDEVSTGEGRGVTSSEVEAVEVPFTGRTGVVTEALIVLTVEETAAEVVPEQRGVVKLGTGTPGHEV